MATLVDTNILLRSIQPHHPHYVVVERAFSKLRSGGESLVVTVQNLYEFWAWERLVTTYRVSGKNSHDARLVAAMRRHGIKRILTFNVNDFSRYPDIDPLDPQAV